MAATVTHTRGRTVRPIVCLKGLGLWYSARDGGYYWQDNDGAGDKTSKTYPTKGKALAALANREVKLTLDSTRGHDMTDQHDPREIVSLHHVRLIRQLLEQGSVYVKLPFNRRHRVHSVTIGRYGEVVLHLQQSNVEYHGEPLDNGIDGITF